MADYWKSIDKKYCDTCKCWITDNVTSVQVHESGMRHKINSQTRLREIQKKARSNEKEDKKMKKTLRQIEEAAALAAAQDKSSNPDMSLKIQAYMDYVKEKELELQSPSTSKPKEDTKVKILHREEDKNGDLFELPKTRQYINRFSGWSSVKSTGPQLDLELPSSSYSVTTGKSKKIKKSSSSATITMPPMPEVTYSAKPKEKPKHVFEEKKIPSFTPVVSSGSSFKIEPDAVQEVAFKKRKFSKSNARRPLDD